MDSKVLKARKAEYLVYKEMNWFLEYFDEQTGGFIVRHPKHSLSSAVSEVYACKAFAINGNRVKLLDESNSGKTADAEIEGNKWEIKELIFAENEVNNVKRAVYAASQKAPNIALFLTGQYSLANINEGIRRACYWDRKDKIDQIALIKLDYSFSVITKNAIQNGKCF